MNSVLDSDSRLLVRLAAAIAGADEMNTRRVIDEVVTANVSAELVDEVILQSYLFAGFPRTLNAARMWRAGSGIAAPERDDGASVRNAAKWESLGEKTCEIVYGDSYEMLRNNVRQLHPALDAWMIADGYGKVLSRQALDLERRELCIVGACAASGQQRQLHSHLHGALNSGASSEKVYAALDSLADLVSEADLVRYRTLLTRVLSSRENVH
ncbi:MAG TPA: carboxymuconolactone decarboxylase family protein [Gemmatimonadaceae bacterium]|nr:carboxymuconolactone decarboxylase family protein [Gemmatimonadaceae bacterium]